MAGHRWIAGLAFLALAIAAGPAKGQCRQGPAWQAELARERPAIAASGGRVERVGDTLFVKAGARRLVFTHPPCRFDEPLEGYVFRRHDVAMRAFVLDSYGYERHALVWIDEVTGRFAAFDSEPVASPDGRWLATLRPYGQYAARLQIWFAPDLVLAWAYDGGMGDWFEAIAGWDGNERVLFAVEVNEPGGKGRRTVRVAVERDGGNWTMRKLSGTVP